MEEEIASMRKEMNMDVVIATTDDAEGKSAETYCEDFYINGGFGTGKDYSGVIFLIDMDNREPVSYTHLSRISRMRTICWRFPVPRF